MGRQVLSSQDHNDSHGEQPRVTSLAWWPLCVFNVSYLEDPLFRCLLLLGGLLELHLVDLDHEELVREVSVEEEAVAVLDLLAAGDLLEDAGLAARQRLQMIIARLKTCRAKAREATKP